MSDVPEQVVVEEGREGDACVSDTEEVTPDDGDAVTYIKVVNKATRCVIEKLGVSGFLELSPTSRQRKIGRSYREIVCGLQKAGHTVDAPRKLPKR